MRNDPDQPVMFDLEFRDWPRMTDVKHATGPRLRFLPDGTVQAVDRGEWRAVGQYELGEWLRVAIELEEGEGKPKTYTVHLGDPAFTVENLAFRSDTVTGCNWLGFAGMGPEPGTFYVDEFHCQG